MNPIRTCTRFARCFGLLCFAFICSVARAADDDNMRLIPPHGELGPTDWERYGGWIVAGSLVVLVAIALGIAWLRRPRPPVITPPDVLARRELEAMRGRPEDANLLVEVSRAFRRYVASALNLPPGELTTAEFQRALQSPPRTDPELTAAITAFLRRCDERKFAPAPPAASTGFVPLALELVDRIERQRQPKTDAVPPPPEARPVSPAAP